MFSVVNLGRHLGLSAETELACATEKFINRFSKMEGIAQEKGIDIANLDISELDKLWNEAKIL